MNHEETTHIDNTSETQEATAETPASENENTELIAAQKQAKDYLEALQRERADFSNYKRRTEREMKDSYANATNSTLMALLPVIDDFERALSSLPEELQDNAWASGVMAIQRKFQKVLDDYGIVVIDPVGEVFDPNRHEAIGTDSDTNMQPGHITTTLQKGYMSGERVLRPALVRVAG